MTDNNRASFARAALKAYSDMKVSAPNAELYSDPQTVACDLIYDLVEMFSLGGESSGDLPISVSLPQNSSAAADRSFVIEHHSLTGVMRHTFIAPEGFRVPTGIFEKDRLNNLDDPNLLALVDHFDIDFQPEKGHTILIQAIETDSSGPTTPTLSELERRARDNL